VDPLRGGLVGFEQTSPSPLDERASRSLRGGLDFLVPRSSFLVPRSSLLDLRVGVEPVRRWVRWCGRLVGFGWSSPLHSTNGRREACAGSRYARSSLLDRRLWMRAGSGVDPLVRLAGRVRADLSLSTRQPWHREACGRGLDTLLPRYSTRELVCDLVREWVRWWGWRVGFEWSRPLYLTKGRREACAGSRYARSSLLDRRVFGVSEVGAWGAPVELSDGGASMLVRVAVLLRSAVCLGMARDLDLSVLARGPIPH